MGPMATLWAAPTNGSGGLVIVVAVVVAILLLAPRKARSRSIPVRSKRIALAKFYLEHYSDSERRKKKRLNIRDYEFDHITPFSRGGTHAPDNIRVIPRKENRKKGAKMPWER